MSRPGGCDTIPFVKSNGRRKTRALSYRIVLTPAEEGGYTVTVPALPGCISEGDSYEAAVRNIKDAVRGYIAVARKRGDPVPPSDCIEDVVRAAVLSSRSSRAGRSAAFSSGSDTCSRVNAEAICITAGHARRT